MAKKEVYRSFGDVLDGETREGYIVYEIENYYEIRFLSVYSGRNECNYRVAKGALRDFADAEKVSELYVDVTNGCRDGQAFWRGKWYSQEMINKIQRERKDHDWKKYV